MITSSDEIGYDGEGNEGSMTDELSNNYVTLNGKKKRRARRQKSGEQNYVKKMQMLDIVTYYFAVLFLIKVKIRMSRGIYGVR